MEGKVLEYLRKMNYCLIFSCTIDGWEVRMYAGDSKKEDFPEHSYLRHVNPHREVIITASKEGMTWHDKVSGPNRGEKALRDIFPLPSEFLEVYGWLMLDEDTRRKMEQHGRDESDFPKGFYKEEIGGISVYYGRRMLRLERDGITRWVPGPALMEEYLKEYLQKHMPFFKSSDRN